MENQVKVTVISPAAQEKAKLRVAAYARVSSDSADQLNSYLAQVDYYTRHIGENPDWELADVYADEGISGLSTRKRDEFNRMMADCRAGKIDRVLVKSVSRFARNAQDTLYFMRELLRLGVTIRFEKENVDTGKLSPEQPAAIYAAFAQMESTAHSGNMRASVRMRMEKGIFTPSSMPYGYRLNGLDPEIVPEEAQVVRRIFGPGAFLCFLVLAEAAGQIAPLGPDFLWEPVRIAAEDAPGMQGRVRTLLQQTVAALAAGIVDRAGHGEHLPALVQGAAGGDERAAAPGSLHHNHAHAQAADDPVALGEVLGHVLRPRGILGENHAPGRDVLIEAAVLPGIGDIVAPGDDGGGEAAGAQRAAVGRRVHAHSQTGDDQPAPSGDLAGQTLPSLQGVGGGPAGAHHGQRGLSVKEGHPPLDVEQQGRVGDIPQAAGIGRVLEGEELEPHARAVLQNAVRPAGILVRQGVRRRPGHSRRQQVLLPLAVVDGLGVPEVVQQAVLELEADALEGGQPEPVLPCGHELLPPFCIKCDSYN